MESDELRDLIRSRGHFEIKVWPLPFRKSLLPDGRSRAALWESCEVRLMGWSYPAPYLAKEARDNGAFLEMPVDYEGFLEAVRVYPSGQVAHLRGFFEDWPERRHRRPDPGGGQGPYLWVDGLLGTITGAYRFAHRVAGFTESSEVELSISLRQTQGRHLRVSDSLFPYARGSDITKVASWTGKDSVPIGMDEAEVDGKALTTFGEICAALTYTIPRDYPDEWKVRQERL